MLFFMTAIFTYLLVLLNFSNTLTASSASHERLPGLDDETMQATFGMSPYHSSTMRDRIGIFHATGDTWTSVALSEYFLTGIFQHYAHELSAKILGTDSALSRDAEGLLNKVKLELKSNPIFVGLGICFHRNKVRLEKKAEELGRIPKTLRSLPVREIRAAEIMAIDRITIDQQTALYYWMKETLEGSANYIKSIFESSGKLPDPDDEVLRDLSRHEPEFLTWSVYKALVPLALAEKL